MFKYTTTYVRACVNCFWSDTSVDLDVEMWCHLTNSPNFAHHVRHEGLATVPGFHCHNQDHVGITYIFLNNFNAGVGFHSNASLKRQRNTYTHQGPDIQSQPRLNVMQC